jgi:hypothetical protein
VPKELNDTDNALRTVRLEEVAKYLGCTPQRLATALRRLAEDPSVVKYGTSEIACISPAVTLYSLTPEAEAQILEELLLKPNDRRAA